MSVPFAQNRHHFLTPFTYSVLFPKYCCLFLMPYVRFAQHQCLCLMPSVLTTIRCDTNGRQCCRRRIWKKTISNRSYSGCYILTSGILITINIARNATIINSIAFYGNVSATNTFYISMTDTYELCKLEQDYIY